MFEREGFLAEIRVAQVQGGQNLAKPSLELWIVPSIGHWKDRD